MRQITVTRNESASRFEAWADGHLLGYLAYQRQGNIVDLPHTLVFPEYEGQGVGSSLVQQALDQIRAESSHLRVQPTCPFVDIWIRRHKQYHDLRA